MNKKYLSFLFIFALLACLFTVTAFAAPYHPGWESSPLRSQLDDQLWARGWDNTNDENDDDWFFGRGWKNAEDRNDWYEGRAERREECPMAGSYADAAEEPDAFLFEEDPFETWEENESPVVENPDGDAVLNSEVSPAEEEFPVLPEETPESIEAAKALAEQIQPDGPVVGAVTSSADIGMPEDGCVTVSAEETFYATEGMTVYNNGGTVYSNLATIYNNGGTVYSNDGLVYNNAGLAYSNGGIVYNNLGTVYSNGAAVYGFEDGGVVESMLQTDISDADMMTADAETAIVGETPVDMETAAIGETPADMDTADVEIPADMDTAVIGETPADMMDDPMEEEIYSDGMAVWSEEPDSRYMNEEPADMLSPEDPMNDDSDEDYYDEYFYEDSPDSFGALDMYPSDGMYVDDELNLYAPVIETYRAFLNGEEPTGGAVSDAGDYYLELGETGISYLSYDAETLGYCLIDLDGDGVSELLVGSLGSDYYDGYIYDMFTLADGVPYRVLASSGRSRYCLTEDDLIIHEGSGGASYSFIGLYEFTGYDIELLTGVVMLDDYYYQVYGDSVADYCEDGEQEVSISEEEFYVIVDVLEDSVVPFQISEFA